MDYNERKTLAPLPRRDPRQDAVPGGAPCGPAWFYLEPAMTEQAGPAADDGLRLFQMLLAYKWTVLLFTIAGIAGGIAWTLAQPPVFRAKTTFEIQELNQDFLLNLKHLDPTAGDASVQTHVRVLQSRSLVGQARSRLQGNLSPYQPAVQRRVSRIRAFFGLKDPTAETALQMAAGNVKVQAIGQTRIVEIATESTNPAIAAAFTEQLASEYMDYMTEGRWAGIRQTSEWLEREIASLRQQLESAEKQLQHYANSSGLVFSGDRESAELQRLRQLQQEYSSAQAERISKQSAFEIARATAVEAVPQIVDNGRLNDYAAKIAQLRRDLAELVTTLTPEHYRVKRVQAQITELQGTLERERSNILTRIQNDFEAAKRNEDLLALRYKAQSELVNLEATSMVSYKLLQREVETNRQLYESMLQKVKEAGVSSAMQASNIRIVDHAQTARTPYKPNPTINAAMGGSLGLAGGLLLAFLRARLDRSFHRPGEVSSFLRLPELGVIPYSRPAMLRRPRHHENGRSALTIGLLNRQEEAAGANDAPGIELATWQRKPSLIAESFRASLASILFSGDQPLHPGAIVVTSPGPKEGKTSVTTNLGIALAEIGQRVLLIDGDMRSPRLHRIFSLGNSWGLCDLLRETTPVEAYPFHSLSKSTKIQGVFVLPSGPGAVSIANLLYSPRLGVLLRRLREEFDSILIDTPPMLQLQDARVLARLADATVLVIRAGTTSRDVARSAKERLEADGVRLLGTIMTYWDPRSARDRSYHDYYYRNREELAS